MKLPEYLYNGIIHLGLPVAAAGTYLAFLDRNPYQQTLTKFSTPSSDVLRGPCNIWFHGASVGEAGLINQLIAMAQDIGVQTDRIVVSTQTESGLESVDHNRKFQLPADYPALVGPVSDELDADCLAVVETEIWPNLYRLNSGKVILLNARISDDTYRYYRWLSPLLNVTLNHTQSVYARSDRDYDRFLELGVDSKKLGTAGDLKWTRALDPPEEQVEVPWHGEDRRVLTVASTHPGEEKMVLDAVDHETFAVNLAPRHLSRLDEVEDLLNSMGLNWEYWSNLPLAQGRSLDVLLVDEFGLLEGLYRGSDLAIIGGSWRTSGGHNLLEAAQYGVPVITGPRIDNFREMAELLEGTGLLEVVSEKELDRAIQNQTTALSNKKLRSKTDTLRSAIKPVHTRYIDALKQTLEWSVPRE
ncbi:MAG: 3-deoxy-D-manno-octulosonic acid transferase [bacterium]